MAKVSDRLCEVAFGRAVGPRAKQPENREAAHRTLAPDVRTAEQRCDTVQTGLGHRWISLVSMAKVSDRLCEVAFGRAVGPPANSRKSRRRAPYVSTGRARGKTTSCHSADRSGALWYLIRIGGEGQRHTLRSCVRSYVIDVDRQGHRMMSYHGG